MTKSPTALIFNVSGSTDSIGWHWENKRESPKREDNARILYIGEGF
ncbi:hypothetical protein LEP1GSC192_3423 [Leptospira sp. B5-022]|nr:hypothetical protein LEP1GSC192_3423 [Leptospira sp. B5-022]